MLLIVLVLVVCGHAQSVRPDTLVASAIANYYLDLQAFPNYACDTTRRFDGYMVQSRAPMASTELYLFYYMRQPDGSWGPSLSGYGRGLDPKLAAEIVHGDTLDKLYSGGIPVLPRFSFRDIPRLFQPRTVRREEMGNMAVWVVELTLRPHVEWPAELPYFHMVRMWIAQQSTRMLRLEYAGARQHVQYVFRTPIPGFITEFHVESVDGSFLNRKRLTYDEVSSYRRFDVSTIISLP